MHRLLRWTSLLLCLAFVALGVRSIFVADLITRHAPDRTYHEIVTIPSGVRYTTSPSWEDGPRPWRWETHPGGKPIQGTRVLGHGPVYRQWYYFGIGVRSEPITIRTHTPAGIGRMTFRYRVIAVPFAVLAFLSAAPGAASVLLAARRRRVERKRREAGQCLRCGYDLRGSPGDLCPECGAPRQPTSPSSAPASRPGRARRRFERRRSRR